MSVAGISTSSFFVQASQNQQSRTEQFQKEFQQLGQDLQSGDLQRAQSDFASLQQLEPQQAPTTTPSPANALAQALDQLSQDLKSGNLDAAQQDYATIQQDLKSQAGGAHHHHHHSAKVNAENLTQEFAQLGQALTSGNLSAAKQAYGVLEQDLPSIHSAGPLGGTAAAAANLSVNA